MSAESAYYVAFPWLAKGKKPKRIAPYLGKMALVWGLGMVPGLLYMGKLNPDGIAPGQVEPTQGCRSLNLLRCRTWRVHIWCAACRKLDAVMPKPGFLRFFLGAFGFVALFGICLLA